MTVTYGIVPSDRQRSGRRLRVSERKAISTGRNLPVAMAVGLALGALVLVTLLTVKVTFLIPVAALVGIALWELSHAVVARQIRIPVIPIAVGGAAMMALAYWRGPRAALAALALTFIAVLAWRLPGGAVGYLRDVMAGVFALVYLPTMAVFVVLMLAQPSGAHRALLFAILAVCSDLGGYFAGILIGRHPMAPTISPKKTWEGLAGSVVACLAAGALGLTLLLHGKIWQGLVLGAAAVAAATLGDLVESMIKRDLEIKDMSSILPGHGGVLERLDSLLIVAPVAWLLMTIFLAARH
jgi:phosphatidate cytidylyltransferase